MKLKWCHLIIMESLNQLFVYFFKIQLFVYIIEIQMEPYEIQMVPFDNYGSLNQLFVYIFENQLFVYIFVHLFFQGHLWKKS